MIELRAAGVVCAVAPEDGGRVDQLTVHGRPLLRGRPSDQNPMTWGLFPMVPFAGRIREGRFAFGENEYQLELNLAPHPHAIHGVAYNRPWSVSDVGDDFVAMSQGLEDHWPFGGATHQHIELSPDRLDLRLSITADQLTMPAQVGWHPWFTKPLGLHTDFASMYVRDADGIPTGELVTPPPGPWDDCFVGVASPPRLDYGDLVVTVDSDCSHWVIYDEQDSSTCVEPQSGPPNGFNSAERGAFVVLEPGETLSRTMTITWSRPASPA